MKLTIAGWLAVLVGLVILGAAFLNGFPLLPMVLGLGLVVVGGQARRSKPCPFCRSGIDTEASVCPRCTREQPRAPGAWLEE